MSSITQKIAAKNASVTPMMAQYHEVKAKHPDFLLFYRMGDFFELFFDDAVQASAALGIQLTKRGRHEGDDIPMCGVPVSRADEYLQKLIKKGFRVAVAEQLEEPEAAKKRGPKAVVRRDVVRLVTPGTLTEDALLIAARSNFLASIVQDGKRDGVYCLACVDISTGEFLLSDCSAESLEAEFLRLRPAELLFIDCQKQKSLKAAAERAGAALSPLEAAFFSARKGKQLLQKTFSIAALEGLGEFCDADLQAIGALLHYIDLTQMGAHPVLRPPVRESQAALLSIDAATRSSLELLRPQNEGAPTVFTTIDRTVTAAGARELMTRLVSPSAIASEINRRLDAVSHLVDQRRLCDTLRNQLKAVPDIARALSRLKLRRGGPRDVGSIRDGLKAAQDICVLLQSQSVCDALQEILASLQGLSPELIDKLDIALNDALPLLTRDGGFIKQGYDASLDAARALASDTKAVIANLQADYAAKSGVKSLKIQYNQVFGYFIEVSAGAANALQTGTASTLFRHKQTLSNAVRFITDELSDLQDRIAGAVHEASAREIVLFNGLVDDILSCEPEICQAAIGLAHLDCFSALADLAHSRRYVRPIVDESQCFIVKAGRHPTVEQALGKDGKAFIANDCELDGKGGKAPAFLVMTGPNMAGKSTYLRQNALIAVLAQMGSFVPADEAHIGVSDKLFSRIGAADDLARGRSTFMVEMTETAAILNQATSRSLVILDEIGRGTATFDGLSIAWAVLEHLHDVIGCRGLVATHYHELTHLAETLPRASNVCMAVKDWKDDLVFLHTIEKGAAHRSYGIQAAKLAGVPKSVWMRARHVLSELEAKNRTTQSLDSLHALPLFAHEPQNMGYSQTTEHPTIATLAAIEPDRLTPREALDLVYKLHEQVKAA